MSRDTSKEPRIKVLIADEEIQLAKRLAIHLTDRGFDVRCVPSGKEARSLLLEWKPKFLLADLMLKDFNALELIDFTKTEPTLRLLLVQTIVMSGHNVQQNVKEALRRGAKDFIVKPFRREDLVKRLIFHARNYRQLAEVAAKDLNRFDESGMMLHLTDLILRQALGKGKLEDTLFNLTRMVSMKMDGVRCNLVECVDQKTGYVVTSNDDRGAAGIRLDLYKYPEIIHVVNTGNLIAVENLAETAELRHIRERVKNIAFNSMIVCPVSRRGLPFGVLSLRMPPDKLRINDNEIRFVEIVSHVVSLVLSNEFYKAEDNYWMRVARTSVLNFPDVVKKPGA